MVKQLSHDEKIQIVILFKEGSTQIEPQTEFNRNESTIKRVIRKFRFSNSVDHSCGNGRPKKLTPSLVSTIKIKIESNPKISLRKVAKSIESDFSDNMSHNSVRNALNSANLFAFSARKKPLLSKKIYWLGLIFQLSFLRLI